MAILLSSMFLSSRYLQCLLVVVFLLGTSILFMTPSSVDLVEQLPFPDLHDWTGSQPEREPIGPRPHHPIDDLVQAAERDLTTLLSKETLSLHDAAEAYRERRGRQPPPGFDAWYTFARNRSALMVEEFWDQIYHDLNPFWGIPAQEIREQANDYLHRISLRDGVASFRTDGQERPWMHIWTDLVGSVGQWLPDMDLAINVLDESRLFVPWEDIDRYMQLEKANRTVVPMEELKDTYNGLSYLDKSTPPAFKPGWRTEGSFWAMAAVGCPPGSPGRTAVAETDFSTPPVLDDGYPTDSYHGYVANFTYVRSPCQHPELRGLHGSFIEPISISTTAKLFPLFGGSKLPTNNEILLPPAMYWTDDPFYSGGKEHGKSWTRKKNGMIWRGEASGGRNRENNWTRFHRHRFVSMANGTSVEKVETYPEHAPPNFILPDKSVYNLAARSASARPGTLGKWIKSWSNIGFINLLCFPTPTEGPEKACSYDNDYYALIDGVPMRKQYNYKYLPDIDGNSFSGRYRSFLGSTSMPIKATIYQEWHDSRLIPWKHFAPMHNTFIDIYGIMEYFLGNREAGVEWHDDVGEKIAMAGKEWTERVLRREDMQIYVLRLLLEYARLCDDDRLILGWKELD